MIALKVITVLAVLAICIMAYKWTKRNDTNVESEDDEVCPRVIIDWIEDGDHEELDEFEYALSGPNFITDQLH